MILHITTNKEWEKAQLEGEYKAESLKKEGFIHCSTIKQTINTANLFFKGQKELIILCLDEIKLTAECRYEASTGGGKHELSIDNLFPHIYGAINLSAIVKVIPFSSDEEGFFSLPEELK